jgi:hypothetical protein
MSNLDQRETFRTVHRLDVADEPWPTLADRELVLEAWLAVAPPQLLPRCLEAIEPARVAAQYGIRVEVEARNAASSSLDAPPCGTTMPESEGALLDPPDPQPKEQTGDSA